MRVWRRFPRQRVADEAEQAKLCGRDHVGLVVDRWPARGEFGEFDFQARHHTGVVGQPAEIVLPGSARLRSRAGGGWGAG